LIADALTDAERQVIDAAVLWVNDQACSSALACLEDAVADLLRRRRERRAPRPHPAQQGAAPQPDNKEAA
jgi:hypothetical protein